VLYHEKSGQETNIAWGEAKSTLKCYISCVTWAKAVLSCGIEDFQLKHMKQLETHGVALK